MEDTGTVTQLKNALNQLLNAYESLKAESEQLKLENKQFMEDLENLEDVNGGLNDKLNSLNNTTEHHSSEMGEMLDRIESILGNESEQSETNKYQEENILDSTLETAIDEIIEEETEETKEVVVPGNNPRDIDLGRMQSLLNGFNN